MCSWVPLPWSDGIDGCQRAGFIEHHGFCSTSHFCSWPTQRRAATSAGLDLLPAHRPCLSHDGVGSVPVPGLSHLLDVFTFPHSVSSPCPPYKYTKSPAATSPTQELGSKHLQPLGIRSPQVLLDECLQELREPGKFSAVHPWVWRQPPSQPISICKALEGTVRVGGRAQAIPFCPTMGGILLSCANYLHALGGHKPKVLLRKPVPSCTGLAPQHSPSALHRAGGRAAGSGWQMGTACVSSAGAPGDSFPSAVTGKGCTC